MNPDATATPEATSSGGTWMMPTFVEGQRLVWILVAIVALVAFFVYVQLRRRPIALRFTQLHLLDKVAPRRPDILRYIGPIILIVGILGMGLAAADPARVVEVQTERATIMLAIDTSLSMMAEDVRPSRIEAAKEAAKQFAADLPPQINLGLVSFNGIATVRVTPTTNRQAVIGAIDSLQLNEATAIGEAIFASLQAINDMLPDESGTLPPARIVVMSDGSTTAGRPDEDAVAEAQKEAVPVSTIAFGTDGGSIVLPADPGPIAVPVNRDALAEIADETGGDFFTAESGDELAAVYEDIGSQTGVEREERPVAAQFALWSFIASLIGAVLSLWWGNRLP